MVLPSSVLYSHENVEYKCILECKVHREINTFKNGLITLVRLSGQTTQGKIVLKLRGGSLCVQEMRQAGSMCSKKFRERLLKSMVNW